MKTLRVSLASALLGLLLVSCGVAPGAIPPTVVLLVTTTPQPVLVVTATSEPPNPFATLIVETPPVTATLTIATPEVMVSPTACLPVAVTNQNANVRSGPGTDYPTIGAINKGGSARVTGRNLAAGWWYIEYPSSGRYSWIAGSVVDTACLPDVIPNIPAPPLPTRTFTPVPTATRTPAATHTPPAPTPTPPPPTSTP